MARYRKKPLIIEATQWFKNGDHPLDGKELFTDSDGEQHLTEGNVVRYYRTPAMDGQHQCGFCGHVMHDHGWIDTPEQDRVVCPGDFIVTIDGQHYAVKPAAFHATYDLA